MIKTIVTTFFATLFLLTSGATFALANDPESLNVCYYDGKYCAALRVTIKNNGIDTYYLVRNLPIMTKGVLCGTLGATSVAPGETVEWSFLQWEDYGIESLLILANKEHSKIIAIVAKQNMCMSATPDVNTSLNSNIQWISITNTKGQYKAHLPGTPPVGLPGTSVITISD